LAWSKLHFYHFKDIAISTAGEVYACGLSSNGRLGLTQDQIGSDKVLNVFEMIKVQLAPSQATGQNYKIDQAHCGNDFTLLLTQNGALLSAGSGRHGANCNFDQQN
jgi:alpha-tubulin suppressor-like RCC1 family protein